MNSKFSKIEDLNYESEEMIEKVKGPYLSPTAFLDKINSMQPDEQYETCGITSWFARKDVTRRENHFLHLLCRVCDGFSKGHVSYEDVYENYTSFLKNFYGELGYQVMAFANMVLSEVDRKK